VLADAVQAATILAELVGVAVDHTGDAGAVGSDVSRRILGEQDEFKQFPAPSQLRTTKA
jgi:hypothetical protein